MNKHEMYLKRCFELAKKGALQTKSNPMVGAIIVHDGKIIAEGYHEKYGSHHAEINCFKNVPHEYANRLNDATLYISLEPCCIESKTPPCTRAIINSGIKKVVFSVSDPNPKIAGKSIQTMENQGIEVLHNILPKEGEALISKFKANLQKKAQICLKFAQSFDRYIGKKEERIKISNQYTDLLVHKWRSEFDAILIGTNTAILDNPKLNNRHYQGPTPIRIILDRNLRVPQSHEVWCDDLHSIFISEKQKTTSVHNKEVLNMEFNDNFWMNLTQTLFKRGIYSILVEGGAKIHQDVISQNCWDEARIITSPIILGGDIKAPIIKGIKINQFKLAGDRIDLISREFVN